MAYSLNEVCIVFSALEVEAAAAILKQADKVDLAASAALQSVYCPSGFTIDSFGVTVTEALTNAHATNLIITLQTQLVQGGGVTAKSTLNLPAEAAEVTLGDILPSGATQAQAVAIGARFYATLNLPFVVIPGGMFYVEATTAAGAAGGAVQPFVIGRVRGRLDAVAANPVTPLAA